MNGGSERPSSAIMSPCLLIMAFAVPFDGVIKIVKLTSGGLLR